MNPKAKRDVRQSLTGSIDSASMARSSQRRSEVELLEGVVLGPVRALDVAWSK